MSWVEAAEGCYPYVPSWVLCKLHLNKKRSYAHPVKHYGETYMFWRMYRVEHSD